MMRTETDNNGEDIISNMPESILRQILSGIPTKDVVRTSVLSKVWEYKWTCVYNIDIDDKVRFSKKRPRKKKMNTVVEFVDRVLLLSLEHSDIKSLRLSFSYNDYSPDHIVVWLSAVLRRHVENLDIVYSQEGVVLPRCLFFCKTLVKLKLQMPCSLRISVQYWFSNLKMLNLFSVDIVNCLVSCTSSQLLLDFPLLETLELKYCQWSRMNSVEIKAPALAELKVTCNEFYHSRVEECQIKISGAKALSLFFYSNFAEFFDLSESSVSSAVLNFPTDLFGRRSIEGKGLPFRLLFLKGFSGLNHLEIRGDTVEAIIQSKQGPPLPLFEELKRLQVNRKCSSGALLELLHVMPFLESITLDMSMWDVYDYDDEVKSIPSCIVSHLSEVEFLGFKGNMKHVQMANYLLSHAVKLERMLGLHRNRSQERKIEKNFWAELKNMFKDGKFDVGSSIKTMVDFESLFG